MKSVLAALTEFNIPINFTQIKSSTVFLGLPTQLVHPRLSVVLLISCLYINNGSVTKGIKLFIRRKKAQGIGRMKR